MPIYEYQCTDCGFETEIIQKFSDPLKTECEQCGKSTFQKKMSLPSFQLKGGGWYSDGYGVKNEKGDSPDKPGKETSGTTDGKTPETKTETSAAADKSGGTAKSDKPLTENKSADTAKSSKADKSTPAGKPASPKNSNAA